MWIVGNLKPHSDPNDVLPLVHFQDDGKELEPHGCNYNFQNDFLVIETLQSWNRYSDETQDLCENLGCHLLSVHLSLSHLNHALIDGKKRWQQKVNTHTKRKNPEDVKYANHSNSERVYAVGDEQAKWEKNGDRNEKPIKEPFVLLAIRLILDASLHRLEDYSDFPVFHAEEKLTQTCANHPNCEEKPNHRNPIMIFVRLRNATKNVSSRHQKDFCFFP